MSKDDEIYYSEENRDKAEVELLNYLSHWIYTKLKVYGQITQNDIDVEFDSYNSPILYDGLDKLENVGIIYSDIVFNQEMDRTEKIFYAKKVIM